jgi:RHS repeat-associated protein
VSSDSGKPLSNLTARGENRVRPFLKVLAALFLCFVNYLPAEQADSQTQPSSSQASSEIHEKFSSGTNWNLYKAKGRMRQLEGKATLSQLTYDANGRLTKVLEPNADNKLTIETDFVYDPNGKILSITQHGDQDGAPRTRTFTYDSHSRISSETSPEAGTVTYTHDGAGNISSKTDARGITIIYKWDSERRLLQKEYSDGTPAANFVYKAEEKSNYSYIEGEEGRRLERRYHYNSKGSVDSVVEQLTSKSGLSSYHVGIRYDNRGRIEQIDYPDGRNVAQSWNGKGQLTSVTSGDVKYLSDATYFSSGDLHTATFGNGTTITRLYNSLGRLSQYTAQANGEPLLNNRYQYTSKGSVASLIDDLRPSQSFIYRYDNLQRISNVSQADDSYKQSFQYDSFGNRGFEGTNISHEFDANNRFSSSSDLAYDQAGDMTFDGTHHYSYNADGLIVDIDNGAATYVYDAEGNRVQKNINGAITDYVWLDDQLLAQKEPDGTWIDYVYADGQRIASTTETHKPIDDSRLSSSTVYFLTDTFGVTRLELSDKSEILSKGTFAPFGRQIGSQQNHAKKASSADEISFTGEVHDSESGLDSYKYRSYNPALGRWMSPDPSGLHFARLDNPQTFNLYSYVTNDPLKYVDVHGLKVCSDDDDDDDGCTNPDDDDDDGGGGTGGGSGSSGGGTPIDSGSSLIYDPAAGGEVTVTADLDPAIDPIPVFPSEDALNISSIPAPVLEWASKQTEGVAWWSWQYGNWCGKGGAGQPIDTLDAACMVHDYCYSTNGFSFAENYTSTVANAGKASTLQACNQALCNAASSVYAEGGPTAAESIVNLFELTPKSAYACN